MSIIKYAKLAEEILEKAEEYIQGKKLIYSFFKNENENLDLETIKLRLTIIDSMYSTNMSRRLFGISDLSKEILEISQHKDSLLKSKLKIFINKNTNEEEIKKLFNKKFGIDKRGINKGKAVSLISKYFYFLTKFEFPIYDSLVKDYLPEVIKKHFLKIEGSTNKNPVDTFKYIINCNKKSEIEDFNILDNMCWLYGKVKKGSYSLILNKENYKKLIREINVEKLKSEDIDKEIYSYVKENISNLPMFTGDEKKFIELVNKKLEF